MSDTKLLTCPICDKGVTVALGGDPEEYKAAEKEN